MQIGGTEDHRLLVTEGVEFLRQLFADDLIEALGDNTPIEALDLEVELVVELGQLDRAGVDVDGTDLCSLRELDALACQQGLVTDRRLVVDQPVVGHGFAVRVGVDGPAEDLGRVLGRRRGETDPYGVEPVQHSPIAGQVLALIAHG